MKTHNLVQGEGLWHAHRRNFKNASEIAIVMGFSKYMTRNELLHIKFTGITPDPTPQQQDLFNEGHRTEALARVHIAEPIIGEVLYPVTGTNGNLSASFDGLTMAEDKGFEHKMLNGELREAMVPECTGADLPMLYQVQMEQQCMVSEDTEEILFVASKWNGDALVEERHCWYRPNPKLAEDIDAAWNQFDIDLANYVPPEPAGPKPVADVIKALPALVIQVRGEVTQTNLAAYREAADEFIATLSTELKTDADFVRGAAQVTFCEEAAKHLKLVKQQALSQTVSINELFLTIDHIIDQLDTKRLAIDKLVEAEKKGRKEKLIKKAREDWTTHVVALDAEVAPIKLNLVMPDFNEAAKNKRTPESLKNAVDTELANGKIAADAAAKDVRAKIAALKDKATGYEFLFADQQLLMAKPMDDFVLAITSRIDAHKAAELLKEQAKDAEKPVVQQLLDQVIEDVMPAPLAAVFAASPAVIQMPTRAAVAPATPPSLSLGQISTRLGFALTADFLSTIGFEPSARQRGAVLFHEAQFPHICAALVEHIQSIQALQAA